MQKSTQKELYWQWQQKQIRRQQHVREIIVAQKLKTKKKKKKKKTKNSKNK